MLPNQITDNFQQLHYAGARICPKPVEIEEKPFLSHKNTHRVTWISSAKKSYKQARNKAMIDITNTNMTALVPR